MTVKQHDLSALQGLFIDKSCQVTVLTGAGISAESGIPTFRGPEGYWTIGSKVYMPQELATMDMFLQYPDEIWRWYLYRLGVCLHAEPNAGHRALAEMENKLGDRFALITQNIDNLHIRAGNSLDRTYQIHGNINYTRCGHACTRQLHPLPDSLKTRRNGPELTDDEIHLLHCPDCGEWLRPHVLWFDEYYDEEYFRFESCMELARQTELLLITGTSGATTLPNHITTTVHSNGGTIIDINIEENPFSSVARDSSGGMFIKASAAEILPGLASLCKIQAVNAANPK